MIEIEDLLCLFWRPLNSAPMAITMFWLLTVGCQSVLSAYGIRYLLSDGHNIIVSCLCVRVNDSVRGTATLPVVRSAVLLDGRSIRPGVLTDYTPTGAPRVQPHVSQSFASQPFAREVYSQKISDEKKIRFPSETWRTRIASAGRG